MKDIRYCGPCGARFRGRRTQLRRSAQSDGAGL